MPVVCALSITISLVPVQAFAASGIGSTDALDTPAVAAWEAAIDNPVSEAIDILGGKYGLTGGVFDSSDVFWAAVNGVLRADKVGQITVEELESLCATFNAYFGDYASTSLFNDIVNELRAVGTNSLALALGLGAVRFDVQEAPSGLYRIVEVNQGLWVVNSKGQYPCAEVHSDGITIDGDGKETSKWVGSRTVSELVNAGTAQLKSKRQF